MTIDLRNPWTKDVSAIKMWVTRDDMLEVLKCVLGNAVRVSPSDSSIAMTVSLVARELPPAGGQGNVSASANANDNVALEVLEEFGGFNLRHIGAIKIEVVDRGPGLSQVSGGAADGPFSLSWRVT